jgi:hypothetical protein
MFNFLLLGLVYCLFPDAAEKAREIIFCIQAADQTGLRH